MTNVCADDCTAELVIIASNDIGICSIQKRNNINVDSQLIKQFFLPHSLPLEHLLGHELHGDPVTNGVSSSVCPVA